jgi:very-short-patch-repair endonuclease
LIKVNQYTRIRNGKVQIVKPTVRYNVVVLICKECKNEFKVNGNRVTRKFCSRKCYLEDWKRRIPGHNKGQKGIQVAWNKGLTAETDPRVAKYTATMTITSREAFRTGKRKVSSHRKWKETDIEKILWSLLDSLDLKYLKNPEIRLKNFSTFPDAYLEKYRLCLYADGNYWHNYPNLLKKDLIINRMLPKYNYKFLRFWGSELKNNPEYCLSKIKEVI